MNKWYDIEIAAIYYIAIKLFSKDITYMNRWDGNTLCEFIGKLREWNKCSVHFLSTQLVKFSLA